MSFSRIIRITEILEERGWCRTRDSEVKNFLLKWCLEHQVDWKNFKEGKQLINNIPGQICFADKVNLWYTVRDYLSSRRNIAGFPVQTFLPMTFILDDDNEVLEFLRNYKSKNYFNRTKKERLLNMNIELISNFCSTDQFLILLMNNFVSYSQGFLISISFSSMNHCKKTKVLYFIQEKLLFEKI